MPKQWRSVDMGNAPLHTDWWNRFNDPVLSEMVEEALKNNQDLAESMAKIESAAAQVGVGAELVAGWSRIQDVGIFLQNAAQAIFRNVRPVLHPVGFHDADVGSSRFMRQRRPAVCLPLYKNTKTCQHSF